MFTSFVFSYFYKIIITMMFQVGKHEQSIFITSDDHRRLGPGLCSCPNYTIWPSHLGCFIFVFLWLFCSSVCQLSQCFSLFRFIPFSNQFAIYTFFLKDYPTNFSVCPWYYLNFPHFCCHQMFPSLSTYCPSLTSTQNLFSIQLTDTLYSCVLHLAKGYSCDSDSCSTFYKALINYIYYIL